MNKLHDKYFLITVIAMHFKSLNIFIMFNKIYIFSFINKIDLNLSDFQLL